MRRVVTTVAATAAGIVALLALKPHQPDRSTALAPPPAGASAPSGGTGDQAGAAAGRAARTGTFTGEAIDTRFGPVQVAVTLDAGRLTAVQVLRVPSENRRDREIASYAVPRLTREALAAQTARIDSVSGATYTSHGYTRSLQSALDQARG
ncbi:FMN-binding protein [Streptomyces sp. NPDC046557]|uniref:FMN-binding protein n=1 Tax=Streptomyces sp. NPDC046557 TaxID=3155372 RepID=UPI0033CF8383